MSALSLIDKDTYAFGMNHGYTICISFKSVISNIFGIVFYNTHYIISGEVETIVYLSESRQEICDNDTPIVCPVI